MQLVHTDDILGLERMKGGASHLPKSFELQPSRCSGFITKTYFFLSFFFHVCFFHVFLIFILLYMKIKEYSTFLPYSRRFATMQTVNIKNGSLS